MRMCLSIAALTLVLIAPWTSMPAAAESPVIELAAPRPAAGGDSFQVQVTTGRLPRGARLALTTEAGDILGAVAPFPPGRPSTMAAVPVPASAMVGGKLRLR